MPPELKELWLDLRASYIWLREFFSYIPVWIKDKDKKHDMTWWELPASACRVASTYVVADEKLRQDEASETEDE